MFLMNRQRNIDSRVKTSYKSSILPDAVIARIVLVVETHGTVMQCRDARRFWSYS